MWARIPWGQGARCMGRGMFSSFMRNAKCASVLALLVATAALSHLFMGQAISATTAVPIISTVAGGGTATGSGDGGPARNVRLDNVVDVAVDGAGNLYIAESYAFRVRKVNSAGVIVTIAGNGTQTYNGDGIPATSAAIDVRGIAVDALGNLYIADGANGRIRKVSPQGTISTLTRAGFPTRVEVNSTGVVHVVDRSRIYRIGSDGSLIAVAGNGEYGFSGDGGPAISAKLANPEGIAFDKAGNLYIADHGNDRVRRVTPGGAISTIAGGGPFYADPVALNVNLRSPRDVAIDNRGNLYIAEMYDLVRMVNVRGIIQGAVAPFDNSDFWYENIVPENLGDGGPAIKAALSNPAAISLDAQENLYVADNGNARVRKVTTLPTPATPTGTGAFAPYMSMPVGSYTQHVAVGDVTGDGRDDALLTTTSWGNMYVEPENDMRLWLFVQKPDGTLAAPLKYAYYGDASGARSGTGLGVADLNRDGYEDVVIGTLKGITIFRGSPSGLTGAVSVPGFTNAEVTLSVAILDVNRDSKLDIVTLSGGRAEGGTSPYDLVGRITFYGNGIGGVSDRKFESRPDEYGWRFFRSSDLDGDGAADITSTWAEGGTGRYRGGAEVIFHDGAAGFLATTRMQTGEEGQLWGNAYAVGDFDSDGRKDIVISRSGNVPDAAYSLFRQGAGRSFSEVRYWSAFDIPEEMIGADINGDRKDDLLVVHAGWHSIGYHQQTGGKLGPEIKYYIAQPGNLQTPAIAVGDLNHDGCKDVAMANHNYGLVLLHGRTCMRPKNGSRPLLPPRPPVSQQTGAEMPAADSRAQPAKTTNPSVVRLSIVRWIAAYMQRSGSNDSSFHREGRNQPRPWPIAMSLTFPVQIIWWSLWLSWLGLG